MEFHSFDGKAGKMKHAGLSNTSTDHEDFDQGDINRRFILVRKGELGYGATFDFHGDDRITGSIYILVLRHLYTLHLFIYVHQRVLLYLIKKHSYCFDPDV